MCLPAILNGAREISCNKRSILLIAWKVVFTKQGRGKKQLFYCKEHGDDLISMPGVSKIEFNLSALLKLPH